MKSLGVALPPLHHLNPAYTGGLMLVLPQNSSKDLLFGEIIFHRVGLSCLEYAWMEGPSFGRKFMGCEYGYAPFIHRVLLSNKHFVS